MKKLKKVYDTVRLYLPESFEARKMSEGVIAQVGLEKLYVR